MLQSQGAYSFAQEPLPVSNKKSKYRDPFPPQEKPKRKQYQNLMWEKAVYRGNTYAAQVLPVSAQQETMRKRKAELARKRRMEQEKKRLESQRYESITTPRPVQGRKHIEIQTEQFLEEITDRVIEAEVETQTDPFLDRPDSPLFIPQKSGEDKAVQIEEDLFDFDFEVEPILEVLVGKTLEQSLLEVMEEEEMKALKEHQQIFEQKRNAELAETQRLERAEQRRFEEKERRIQQERERLKKEKETKEKLASTTFAKSFLQNLETRVFQNLEKEGYFYDVVEREVEMEFMPWLMERVQERLEEERQARQTVDDLIKNTLRRMLQTKA